MTNTDEERAELQRKAAAAYDSGDLELAADYLLLLGGKNWSQQAADLIDGAILNKHLGLP